MVQTGQARLHKMACVSTKNPLKLLLAEEDEVVWGTERELPRVGR